MPAWVAHSELRRIAIEWGDDYVLYLCARCTQRNRAAVPVPSVLRVRVGDGRPHAIMLYPGAGWVTHCDRAS